MPLRYQKPPLVEALCELRFVSAPDKKWDWAVPGLLYPHISDRFPTRRERVAIGIPIAGPASSPVANTMVQFLSTDERMMVQVGPDLLAVNSLREHLGWPDLRETLLGVLKSYREIASPAGLAMTALRYINHVEVPLRPGFALERYFAVLPGLPEGVPAAVSTFLMHTEVAYEDPPALFRFRFGTTASALDVAGFMLDYEHVAAPPAVPGFESLRDWLDVGHDRIERAFYGSFTTMTHAEVFQEIRS